MPVKCDEHGQPTTPFRFQGRSQRTVDELIGICKGVVADGVFCEKEAAFLVTWMNENAYTASEKWPVNVLLERLDRALRDNVIDPGERTELFEVLSGIVGGVPAADRVASFSATLNLDAPHPVIFSEMSFCFTGQFACGTRKDCERAVLERGGTVVPAIRSGLDYLVVGLVGSRDWAHSTFGRKMEKAFEYREKFDIMIIGEDHWAKYL